MKRVFTITLVLLAALLFPGTGLRAQTPEEILEKMSAQMDRGETEGFTMDLNMKIPIVGTITSHNMSRGDKLKGTASGADKSTTYWTDKTTKWTYDPQKNEITIENNTPSESSSDDDDMKAFDSLNNGYDITLQKETAEAWYFVCKKNKTNKVKDDPKKIELAVSKATFLPIYLKTKQSLITISIENYTLGVSEKSVTFNMADFPTATVVDKR